MQTPMTVDRTADVVIVGAGICGSSTALELSRSGLKVLVVDKAGGPGHGSTSASSSIVRFNYSTFDGIACSWESKFRWEAWEEYLGHRDPNGLAAFIHCGLVLIDVENIPKKRMAELFGRAGIPCESLSPTELQQLVPGIDTGRYFPPKPVDSEEFFTPAQGLVGGLYTPDAGDVDDPQLAAANLASAAQAAGASFAFRRTVSEIVKSARNWTVTLDGADKVTAPIVVNAAGPWSSAVNRMAGVGTDFTVRVGVLRQEVHQAPRPPGLAERTAPFPIIADLDLGVYIRPDSGHSLLVGGTEPECDPLEWIQNPDDFNPQATAACFEAQLLRAARRLPDLKIPNRPRGLAGIYDVASDWTPIYDRTEHSGFYVAMGTSGNQFKNAPVIGELMKTLILAVEGGHEHDYDPVGFDASITGQRINLGSFSRKRELNAESSGTVFG